MYKLAIKGGPKIRRKKFPAYVTVGKEEIKSIGKVIKSGILSKYLGVWHKNFYGGPQVNKLEKTWQKLYKVKHAITVNSATSGLYCAVGSLGIEPGDEVIVSPYTMSASAVAPLIYGAIPVFADIEEDYFCLSPKSIEQRITKYTKAIIIVDLFGQPYEAQKINKLAKKHNLYIIEDAAQAPLAMYGNKLAGTLGDIGIYSLNYHKIIHSGEGGIVVTNDDELAERIRLIRNHAESVVEYKKYKNLVNMVGFNFRMTEIQAAIALEQLKKLPKLLKARKKNIEYLDQKLSKIPCLGACKIRPNSSHSFYVRPLKYNTEIAGIHRNKFIEAVKAELTVTKLREDEGVKVSYGYVKPLYLLPLFQKRIAFGSKGYPWKNNGYKGKVNYNKGICPIAEKMHYEELIIHELFQPEMTKKDLNDVAKAFEKVWKYRKELR